MRITTTYGAGGVTLLKTVDDNGDGTATITIYGDEEPLTTVVSYTPPPFDSLDPTGALATLLVVEGVLTLTDAALAVQQPEQALIDEALAWSLGQ